MAASCGCRSPESPCAHTPGALAEATLLPLAEALPTCRATLHGSGVGVRHSAGVRLVDSGGRGPEPTRDYYVACASCYKKNRQTGSLIIIDAQTNETIGAGMII